MLNHIHALRTAGSEVLGGSVLAQLKTSGISLLNAYCTWKTAKATQSHFIGDLVWCNYVYIELQYHWRWTSWSSDERLERICSPTAVSTLSSIDKTYRVDEMREKMLSKGNSKSSIINASAEDGEVPHDINVSISAVVFGWVQYGAWWGRRWWNLCPLNLHLLISRYQDSLCISYQSSRQCTASLVILCMGLCLTETTWNGQRG